MQMQVPYDSASHAELIQLFTEQQIFTTGSICRRQIKCCCNEDSSYDRVKKCWLPALSPFPAMFSKGFFFRVIESWDCVIKS